MTRLPRGLTTGEQAAWAHLAASVTPMSGREQPNPPQSKEAGRPVKSVLPNSPPLSEGPGEGARRPKMARPVPSQTPPQVAGDKAGAGLDSHWDRRMKGGRLDPDLTLDLHDCTLDAAYDRIMAGLDQARMMNARVVLVIAGRERPVDPADRMVRRGAIRAKLLDWLAASRHGSAIGAVRKAHIRHGGEGALYLILKR